MSVQLDEEDFIATYNAASTRFREVYKYYSDYREEVIKETRTMFDALKEAGYTNKAAINKIVEDHKDLKGFSQKSIYRNLPDDVKDQTKRNNRLGYHNEPNSVVKNGEFDNKTLAMPETESVRLQEDIQNHIADLERENKFLKEGLQHFKEENSTLRKKLEEYEGLPNNDVLYHKIATLKQEKKELEQELKEASDLITTLQGNNKQKEIPKQPSNQPNDWLLSK